MIKTTDILRSLALMGLRRGLRALEQRPGAFFVIVMPGGLHIARLAIDHFPRGRQLVVIGNGVDEVEAEWARRNLPGAEVLRTRAMLGHHDVLDAIFAAWGPDFGILDYDCFVLDPGLFDRMAAMRPGTSMNAAFFRDNADPPLKVPETFLLYFNAGVIRDLIRRYGVGTRPIRWPALPERARQRLETIGLSAERPPEAHKPYYDTLRLQMMLGLADGQPYRFVAEIPASPAPNETAFHVGGVSDPRSVQGIWALRGSYFWRRVLEASEDTFLRAHYGARFGDQSAAELLAANAELAREISPEFIDFCDRILAERPRSAVA
jgi:hypothetical protein